jgi:hypothetical protein
VDEERDQLSKGDLPRGPILGAVMNRKYEPVSAGARETMSSDVESAPS